MDVVVFILEIRVSRLPDFNNHLLMYLGQLPKEMNTYKSLDKFLSPKFSTQSPISHRASFVFMLTACMMPGSGAHWCQTKIKFAFKSLEILQKDEVSDCAMKHTAEKLEVPCCLLKSMFTPFKAYICPTDQRVCQPGNILKVQKSCCAFSF